jgi:hypothetical protein
MTSSLVNVYFPNLNVARVWSLCNRWGDGRLSLSEEHVDAAEQFKPPTVGLAGGLDHPLDDLGAKGCAV